jgi:hypothetical protein
MAQLHLTRWAIALRSVPPSERTVTDGLARR